MEYYLTLDALASLILTIALEGRYYPLGDR